MQHPCDIGLHSPVLLIRLLLQYIHKKALVSACLGFFRSHGYRAAESRHSVPENLFLASAPAAQLENRPHIWGHFHFSSDLFGEQENLFYNE